MIDTVIWGNSIEKIKELPDCFVHAIISDIPYGICYGEWDVLHNNTNIALGGMSLAQKGAGSLFRRRGKPLNGWSNADKNISKEYQDWCTSWASDWLRVLKSGGSCLIFAGRRYAHRCISALEDAGFTFKDMLAWEKTTAPHRAQRISEVYKRRGDNKSAEEWDGWRVANLRPLFEPILWFQKPYKTGGTLADNLLEFDVGAWNERALLDYNCALDVSDGMIQSNIIRISADKDDRGLHETQKPLKLMKLLVSLVTKPGAVIFDPFAGSGTTCVAAKQLRRHYIGMEVDKTYAKIAEERLAECDGISVKHNHAGTCTPISFLEQLETGSGAMKEMVSYGRA
jgi:site-specific DNA-methyltransferase (adenine-specific)